MELIKNRIVGESKRSANLMIDLKFYKILLTRIENGY
jgi:hypothetical protein